jgi:hypothetical protein
MVCAEGYAKSSSGECSECSEAGKSSTISLLIAACLLLAICVWCFNKKKFTPPEWIPSDTKDMPPSELGDGSQQEAAYTAPVHSNGGLRHATEAARAAAVVAERGVRKPATPKPKPPAAYKNVTKTKLMGKFGAVLKTGLNMDSWSTAGAKGKIMLSFMQVIDQIPQVFNIPFPANFEHLISHFGFVNFDILTVVGLGCVAPMSFYGKLLFMTLTPLVLAAGLGVKYKLADSVSAKNKCTTWFLKMTYLVFPGVSTAVFKVFPCYQFDDDTSFLKADLSIDCSGSERPAILAYGVLMVLVYPVGITTMYAALLHKHRKAICPIEGKWGSFLCCKDMVPPQLRNMDEEDKITEQREKDIETNPGLESCQFLFKEYKIRYSLYSF